MFRLTNLVASAALVTVALARTDLSGCTSTDVSSPAGASIAWYVPGTGELCEFLDCGGGRAPPKTTVPGCPLYSGTATYSPSYLPGFGAAAATSVASAAASTSAGPVTTPAVVAPLGSTTTFSSETSSPVVTESAASSSDAAVSSTEVITASAAATGTAESGATSSPAVTSSASLSVPTAVSAVTALSSSTTASARFTTSVGRNTTLPSASLPAGSQPTTAPFTGAAVEVSRVWFGSAGLIALGALVAAL